MPCGRPGARPPAPWSEPIAAQKELRPAGPCGSNRGQGHAHTVTSRLWRQAERLWDQAMAAETAWKLTRSAFEFFTPEGRFNDRQQAQAVVAAALPPLERSGMGQDPAVVAPPRELHVPGSSAYGVWLSLSPGKEVGQAFQPDKAGKPDLPRELKFIALSRGQRSRSGARKCLLAKPGHESGVRDSRCRPKALVVWIMRPWRGTILKKAQLGEDHCNFKPRRPDHIEEKHRPTGADSSH